MLSGAVAVWCVTKLFSRPIARATPVVITVLALRSAILRPDFNPDRHDSVISKLIIRGRLASGGEKKSSQRQKQP
jgi:hypothetical protein